MPLDNNSLFASYKAEQKNLYEMGEMPPLGYVPAKMYAWAIRRERHGEFGLAQAIPLAQIVGNVANIEKFIIPPEQLLPRIPAAVVSRQNAERVRHGNFVRATDILSLDTIKRSETPRLAESTPRPLVRLLDETGSLLAISEQSGDGTFYPKIVLPAAQP